MQGGSELFLKSTYDKLFDPRLIHASKQRSCFAGKARLLHVRVVVALHCLDESGFLAEKKKRGHWRSEFGVGDGVFQYFRILKGEKSLIIESENFHASHKDTNMVDWI